MRLWSVLSGNSPQAFFIHVVLFRALFVMLNPQFRTLVGVLTARSRMTNTSGRTSSLFPLRGLAYDDSMHEILKLSERVSCLPVIHGSGDSAVEVRRVVLQEQFDCIAVPLPESFRAPVETGIAHLPNISAVVQPETMPSLQNGWKLDSASPPELPTASYVPVDPCQHVISALRLAIQELLTRAFIDL